jgi:hypothetical protein
MQIAISIIRATPSWVWILLIYLIIRGLEARHTRIMPLWRLFIIPTALTLWGLASLFELFGPTVASLTTWAVAAAAGAAVGMKSAHPASVRANREKGLVAIRGSSFILGLVLAAFAAKYSLDYLLATIPELTSSSLFIMFEAGVLGLAAGLPIGRVWIYYQKYLGSNNGAARHLRTTC